MKRDLSKLSTDMFDLLVIGSGIHGATIAYQAARSGLNTALIDQADFGHATSANSLKIIHGGLRYLQHLNIKRMRESIKSRRKIIQFAPEFVKPLQCLVPTFGLGLKSKLVMRMAFIMNDLISWDRNKNVLTENLIPGGKTISKNEVFNLFPDLEKNKTTGGAIWYDGLAVDTERLLLKFILCAHDYGATLANYVKVKDLKIIHNKVEGALVEDVLKGKTFEINSKFVIDATGPWLDSFKTPTYSSDKIKMELTKAINIVVKKPLVKSCAIGLESSEDYFDKDAVIKKGKRFFFFVPWRGYTMIGTTYKPYIDKIENLSVEKADIIQLIQEVNTIYPTAQLTFDDVTFVHAGLLPMKTSKNEKDLNVQLDKNSVIYDHGKQKGIQGFYSIKSVKYTTAPEIAKRVIKSIVKKNKIKNSNIIKNKDQKKSNIPDKYKYLFARYGERADNVIKYMNNNNDSYEVLVENPLFTTKELAYLISEEMALKLSDIIFRRTALGTAECLPIHSLQKIANVMKQYFNWDEKRKEIEIQEVLNRYDPLNIDNKLSGSN